MQARQEVLDGVAQVFYANTQVVKTDLSAVAECAPMEITRCLPTLQCEMGERRAIGWDVSGTAGQIDRPNFPLSAIEMLQGFRRGPLQFLLTHQQEISKNFAGYIALDCERLDPVPHHLRIAQFSEAAEHLLSRSSHLLP